MNRPGSLAAVLLASLISPALAAQTQPTLEVEQFPDGMYVRVSIHDPTQGEPVLLAASVSMDPSPPGASEEHLLTAALHEELHEVSLDKTVYDEAFGPLAGASEQLVSSFRAGTQEPFPLRAKYVEQVLAPFVSAAESGFAEAIAAWAETPGPVSVYYWQGSAPEPHPVIPWEPGSQPGEFLNEPVVRHLLASQISTPAQVVGPHDEEVDQIVRDIKEGAVVCELNMQAIVIDPAGSSPKPDVKIRIGASPTIILPNNAGGSTLYYRVRQGEGAPYLYAGIPGSDMAVEAAVPLEEPSASNTVVVFPTATSEPAFADAIVAPGSETIGCVVPDNAIGGTLIVWDQIHQTAVRLENPYTSSPTHQVAFKVVPPQDP